MKRESTEETSEMVSAVARALWQEIGHAGDLDDADASTQRLYRDMAQKAMNAVEVVGSGGTPGTSGGRLLTLVINKTSKGDPVADVTPEGSIMGFDPRDAALVEIHSRHPFVTLKYTDPDSLDQVWEQWCETCNAAWPCGTAQITLPLVSQ